MTNTHRTTSTPDREYMARAVARQDVGTGACNLRSGTTRMSPRVLGEDSENVNRCWDKGIMHLLSWTLLRPITAFSGLPLNMPGPETQARTFSSQWQRCIRLGLFCGSLRLKTRVRRPGARVLDRLLRHCSGGTTSFNIFKCLQLCSATLFVRKRFQCSQWCRAHSSQLSAREARNEHATDATPHQPHHSQVHHLWPIPTFGVSV